MIKTILSVILGCAALLGGQSALAQTFPARPVTIVVPYPPGGLIDIVARQLQPRFQTELGQPVIIENRAGAGGNVGAEVVARAAPDGYMLLLANPSLAISPLIYPKLNYRPTEDFAYVGQYGTVPNVLVVHPSIPARNVQEFIAYVKKNPGRLNYGSPGYGTSPQMSSELFKAMTDTFIVHIPFRGSGPAQAAMLGGEIQMMIDNLPPQLAHIKSGKVRALGVTSQKRAALLPDVPAIAETVKGYETFGWYSIVAPKGSPEAIMNKASAEVVKATKDPAFVNRLKTLGIEIVGGGRKELDEFRTSERRRLTELVKESGVTIK